MAEFVYPRQETLRRNFISCLRPFALRIEAVWQTLIFIGPQKRVVSRNKEGTSR